MTEEYHVGDKVIALNNGYLSITAGNIYNVVGVINNTYSQTLDLVDDYNELNNYSSIYFKKIYDPPENINYVATDNTVSQFPTIQETIIDEVNNIKRRLDILEQSLKSKCEIEYYTQLHTY